MQTKCKDKDEYLTRPGAAEADTGGGPGLEGEVGVRIDGVVHQIQLAEVHAGQIARLGYGGAYRRVGRSVPGLGRNGGAHAAQHFGHKAAQFFSVHLVALP